ncbi:glycosyltransferase [Haliangium ochraceum]|nr:glycosyltransferase [Haliangium ochraceum]
MRPMTIAHVLGSFGMGGAERVALDLASAQRSLGLDVLAVSFAGGSEGPLGPMFREAGIPVHTIPKRPGIDLTLPPRVARLLVRERVAVLHTHNPQPLIYAAPAGRAVGTAVVHTKHGEGHMGSSGEKSLRRLTAPFAQIFVAVSEETAAQARAQRDCPLERLTVVPNGIGLGRFAPDDEIRREVRAELGISEDAWVVGTVGRVDDNKNQSALVRAMAPLLSDEVHLVLVGDGPAMDTLRAAREAVDRSDRVHILGRRTDANRLYRSFDVFALPSLSEGLPLVIPEAMACGLPVVSTAVGGIPAVVLDGETGLLVAPDDEVTMRAALAHLGSQRQRARAFGRAGRARALSEYSVERMSRDYLSLYERALDQAGPLTRAWRRRP